MGCCMHSAMSRRQLFARASAAPLAGLPAAGAPVSPGARKTLRVQPILTYEIPQRRDATSWRQWGALQTEADLRAETARIEKDLAAIRPLVPSSVEFLPLRTAATLGEAHAIAAQPFDATLAFAAGGNHRLLEAATPQDRWTLIFIRHRSGPVYLWYEIIHPRYLRKTVDEFGQPGVSVDDIIIDDPADAAILQQARLAASDYLSSRRVTLEVPKDSVERAFVLTHVFRELMRETGATAMTVNQCMGPIMGVSQTTACLPLSVLNDEGFLAFCESDFVVIPAGILLNSIAQVPVFLNDPTYPHHGLVTIAHCTAPRKLDGKTAEPVRILTHFESDFGAAPKVEMRPGQIVTNIIPDFDAKKWVGFLGEVAGNPFLPICRSQTDIGLKCSDALLAREMRGFHWMTSYTSALRETGYAVQKLGIGWLNLSA